LYRPDFVVGQELRLRGRRLVAHALARAVFAVLGTQGCRTSLGRSHDCERDTQECVRHGCIGLDFVAGQSTRSKSTDSLTVAVR